jgi:hypothetical protein
VSQQLPVPQVFFSLDAFAGLPNNLFLFGYFWAYITAAELRALRAQLGEQICEPESLPAGHPDKSQRKVRPFGEHGLTGPEIAAVLQEHGNWFVVIEQALFISR